MTVPQNSTAQVQQWQQRLLYTVAGLLLFETLTGLAIYLLPFSVANQVMVLLHTIVGLVVLLPYAWYQLRHWRTYRALRLSHVKLTGYCTMAATIAAAVSGLVFTIQAIAATRISRGWDIAHVVATFALVAAALPHIVTLVVRASRTRDTTSGAQLLAAAPWCGARTLLLTVGLFVIVAGAVALYRPTKLVNELPADYSYVYDAKNIFTEDLTNQVGYKERVSCVACQAIKETDVKGNAAYVIAQPKRYLFELEETRAGQ